MIKANLNDLIQPLQAQLIGPNVDFTGISIDSRTLQKGQLFIAIKGAHFDGHAYLEQAKAQGAVAAIISQPVKTALPCLQVKDTRLALGQLAHWHRCQFDLPVIGITGSCGKTTTKTMLAAILAERGPVLATQGTLNNDYGVPLTLAGLTASHQYAVIEMGANHGGEIAYLAAIAAPTLGLITNIAPVHLAGFGSLAGVAKGKAELYQALPAHGIAIINGDEPFSKTWQQQFSHLQVLTGSTQSTAEVWASNRRVDEQGYAHFTLHGLGQTVAISLPVLGEHNVSNAVMAATAAVALGFSLSEIQRGLSHMQPVAKRTHRQLGYQQCTIIDDSYNANPLAFRAAIQLLMQQGSGEKILVMGDMGELGPDALAYHAEVGTLAKQYGVHRCYAIGPLSQAAITAFGANGYHFNQQAELIAALKPTVSAATTILVKGSRSAKMEQVVEALATSA